MIDDGTIFKYSDDHFMLTCGSPCTAWLEKSSFGFADVTVTDVTDDIAALAFQGPTTCAVLKNMGLTGIETLKPFGIMRFPFHGDTLTVSGPGSPATWATNCGFRPRSACSCGTTCTRLAMTTASSLSAKRQPTWPASKLRSSCRRWSLMKRCAPCTSSTTRRRSNLTLAGWLISKSRISVVAQHCSRRKDAARSTRSPSSTSKATSRPSSRTYIRTSAARNTSAT